MGGEQARRASCAEASDAQAQLEAKAAAFLALAAALSFTQAVVFCGRQHEAAWLADRLSAAGFPAAFLSGRWTAPDMVGHCDHCQCELLAVWVSCRM